MLSIHLDEESEKYLLDILSEENTDSSLLVKRLLKAYWLTKKQPPQTVLERLGGYPQNFLEEDKDLSDRDTRKVVILEKLQHRYGSS